MPDDSRAMVRVPSSDQRAQPVNQRFARKVLFNHERTQRKLNFCSKKANKECSQSSDVVESVQKTVNDWTEAQDSFDQTVHDKFEAEFFNSPSRREQNMRFHFASNTLARQRIGRGLSIEAQHVPLRHNNTMKRQNSSPSKINKAKKRPAASVPAAGTASAITAAAAP